MRIGPNVRGILAGVGLATALMGCNVNKFTADTTSEMLANGSVALEREADLEFARAAFPASLKTLETFLINSPQNDNLLLLLARGYSSYAFAILETELDEAQIDGTEEQIGELIRRAKIHYLRGSEYGFMLLNNQGIRDATKALDLKALDEELGQLKKADVPALFWATYGWASAVNLAKDDPSMIAGLSAIEKMMKRVYELDPGYYNGAPILFHGVLHASRPKALGGKPELAKKYFDEAMAKHGADNLIIPFMYARFYGEQAQDKKLFDEMLAKVTSADVMAYPDLRLSNEVARHRARFWQKHADEIILPE